MRYIKFYKNEKVRIQFISTATIEVLNMMDHHRQQMIARNFLEGKIRSRNKLMLAT
jgi:hypothetical protein